MLFKCLETSLQVCVLWPSCVVAYFFVKPSQGNDEDSTSSSFEYYDVEHKETQTEDLAPWERVQSHDIMIWKDIMDDFNLDTVL